MDCHGGPLFCTACCRNSHKMTPFHWISQWNGTFFQDSCLANVGLVMHLGHNGERCPSATDHLDLFDGDEWEDEIDPDDAPSMSLPRLQPTKDTMVIVDRSGVHRLIVTCCECPEAQTADIQMFRAGLFPASFSKPKTAFTFSVLNDYLLDNLECGTTAMNYYSKLRRMTSSAFPHLVPV
jgi:hypothetical protein